MPTPISFILLTWPSISNATRVVSAKYFLSVSVSEMGLMVSQMEPNRLIKSGSLLSSISLISGSDDVVGCCCEEMCVCAVMVTVLESR